MRELNLFLSTILQKIVLILLCLYLIKLRVLNPCKSHNVTRLYYFEGARVMKKSEIENRFIIIIYGELLRFLNPKKLAAKRNP